MACETGVQTSSFDKLRVTGVAGAVGMTSTRPFTNTKAYMRASVFAN
jgi:hypothetical protein